VIIEDRIREWGAGGNFSPGSCPANDVAQFSARLTPVAVQEKSSASQFNSVQRANAPVHSHKTGRRKGETSQIKSPNSFIKTRSNSMKTNNGDMLKSPKNQKTRFSLPPAFQRVNSNFFGVLPPRAIPVPSLSPSQIHKWSRPLLTESDSQTEFDLTYRKQTMEKFLTGTRTHIRETRLAQHSGASPLGFPK